MSLGEGGRYVLRFGASKLEADLEGTFLTRGGTLGGAAARAETDFALTHSERATARLLTERHERVDIPLSDALVASSAALFAQETNGAKLNVAEGAHVLLLSDRTQLLVTNSRKGASINGTLVSTMAGTAAVPLKGLFTTVDSAKLVDGESIGHVLGEASPPFAQIPVKYPNWDSIQATIGINAPAVVHVGADSIETAVNVAFFTPGAYAKRMQAVEPVLKSIYEVAWKKTETVKFDPSPTLTKSVTRKAFGFNGSQYSLACEVNDTPCGTTAETLEAVLHGALEVEMQGAYFHKKLLADLSTSSFAQAVKYSKYIGDALSGFAAFTMPYRVDGTPVITPEGVAMVQAESWPTEPVRAFGISADDCDGSAQQVVSLVKLASRMNDDPSVDMARFPNLRAVANSIGAHYVYGTNVLAANSGHAAAADEDAKAVAGHAIMMAVPKPSLLMGMQRGAVALVEGQPVVESALLHAVTNARFNALYPPSLVAQLPEEERACFASHQEMAASNVVHPVSSLQPLACEGTTYAKSTLYTHDPVERGQLKEFYLRDKAVAEAMSPNISRTVKALDVGATGAHAFYSAFVEIGLSLEHPLFTDPALRKLGHATPHLRFAKLGDTDAIAHAGASPKDLATHAFAVVPLWTAGVEDGALIDEAHAESMANVMPLRGVAASVSDDGVADLDASLNALRELNTFLHAPGKADHVDRHETAHLISFAALLQNPKAIEGFCALVMSNEHTSGDVYGLDQPIAGIATAASNSSAQLGRYVTVELMVPI